MPIYEFRCHECGHSFEELVRNNSTISEVVCPNCGSKSILKQVSLFSSYSARSRSTFSDAACTTSL
ncbi:MAG: zinc ribbon domain-containing protein [Anaerolineales bacterium]|nr:zinc ribbon domain-containing protein [Anaerolineales bacterium]